MSVRGRQEQAQSAALAPLVEEARAAVQEAAVVNMDETGWREEPQRAWLWTVVAAGLTVFHIDSSRGGTAVEALLGAEFGGVVGSDRRLVETLDAAPDRVSVSHPVLD